MKKLKIGVMDGIVLLVSVLFLLGTLFVFTPCGPKEDGSWMICHHAGTAVMGIAAVLVLLAVLHLLMPSAKTKLGLAMASLPVAVLAYLISGKLHPLCMMPSMRCHTVMQPAARAISVVMILLACMDIYVYRKGD